MRDLVGASGEIWSSGSDETQAAIFDIQPPALQPEQPMPVGVGYARFFKPETTD
jgi:hypothetical protein